MSINTAKYLAAQRDITQSFDNGVRAATPVYPRIAMVRQSGGSDEKYGWLGKFPTVREWLGDRKFNELEAYDYILKNKPWESSLPIDREDLADDRVGMYRDAASQLGAEASYHPDVLMFQIIQAGTSGLCFDGLPFFSASHAFGPNSDAPATQSNLVAGSATTPANPTPAEVGTAFNAALVRLHSFQTDNGTYVNRPMINSLQGLTILYPPQMNEGMRGYFQADLLGGGNTNVILDRPELMNTPYLLSETDSFYVLVSSGTFRPFIFQQRLPLRRQIKGSNDIEEKIVKFMTYSRYNCGYGFWWLCVKVTLS